MLIFSLSGYKGYAYALFVELLSSSLCGGKTSNNLTGVDEHGKPAPMGLGHFFLCIDIERFVGLEDFKKQTGEFLREIRASEKMPGGPGRIWTPGEKEHDFMVERTAINGTPVPEPLQKEMVLLRDTYPALAAKYPVLPFEE
jgi:L-2-hydroxycarboxylate dehydrogenase (NAD+)